MKMKKKPAQDHTKQSNLLGRIFQKVKKTKQHTNNNSADGNTSNNASTSFIKEPSEESIKSIQYESNSVKHTPEELQRICGELPALLKYLGQVQEFTYGYHEGLQDKISKYVNSIESAYKEMRACIEHTKMLQDHQKALKKEKAETKKLLKKYQHDEMTEMESIISVYDKTMFRRWENLKNSYKHDALQNLLYEVKGKQSAMENLETLVSCKLQQLETCKIYRKKTNFHKSRRTSRETKKMNLDKGTGSFESNLQSQPTLITVRREKSPNRLLSPTVFGPITFPFLQPVVNASTSTFTTENGNTGTNSDDISINNSLSLISFEGEFSNDMQTTLENLFTDFENSASPW